MEQHIKNAGKTVTITIPDEWVGKDLTVVAEPVTGYGTTREPGNVEREAMLSRLEEIRDEIGSLLLVRPAPPRITTLRKEELALLDQIAPDEMTAAEWSAVRASLVSLIEDPGGLMSWEEAKQRLNAVAKSKEATA